MYAPHIYIQVQNWTVWTKKNSLTLPSSYFAVLEMYSKLKEQLESKRYASHNAFQHYVTDVCYKHNLSDYQSNFTQYDNVNCLSSNDDIIL